MLALLSVWIASLSLGLSLAMVVYRPLFADLTVLAVSYFGSPGALCLAGIVLWANRKEPVGDPGLAGQRTQSRLAIVMAILAAAIVYGLVIMSEKIEPIDASTGGNYNPVDRWITPGDGENPNACRSPLTAGWPTQHLERQSRSGSARMI